jgi:hypothetical protein
MTRCFFPNNNNGNTTTTTTWNNNLPNNYTHMEKYQWPELYQMDYKISIAVIQSDRPDITTIEIIHVPTNQSTDDTTNHTNQTSLP